MTTFYLVRHAHADWAPDENRPLSERGRADAARVADVLARYPVSLICSSPYRRARETVAPLAARMGLPVGIEPDLREREMGGAPVEGFLSAVEATWRDPSFTHPGGETNAVAQRRALAVVRRLQAQHPAGRLVLSTHGNLLALVLNGFDPSIDFAFWKRLAMPDIYELRLAGDAQPAIRRLWEP